MMMIEAASATGYPFEPDIIFKGKDPGVQPVVAVEDEEEDNGEEPGSDIEGDVPLKV